MARLLAMALVAVGVLRAVAADPCDSACRSAFVAEHNRVRERVSEGKMPAPKGRQPRPASPLAPLAWDAELAKGAQAWSDRCSFAHSNATKLGENLFASAGTPATPEAAVESWEGESSDYSYAAIADPVNVFDDVGHYTQLVWSGTTRFGCAVTHCTTDSPFPKLPAWDLVVCRYSPPGNVVGKFPYEK
ncbi:MAG TPA: CAP domain-containing protein [Candidatus Polarisedimenticolaceae bacterium]|nr:CAP domain-containing protein [Candidatus Polarisedimenticolaceae bacterium]